MRSILLLGTFWRPVSPSDQKTPSFKWFISNDKSSAVCRAGKYLFKSFVQNKNRFKIIEQIANSWDLTGITKTAEGIRRPSNGERFTGCRAGELKK